MEEAKPKQSPSPDVSSSMKEFLEKEKMCKAMHKFELEVKDKDDTLCDILASAAFDKYSSDFEYATDEDIGSILEEMSKIAGALSPNSAPERAQSRDSSKHPTEEEKSVEELLEEAEKLVRKNSSSLSKSGSKSDTLVPENIEGESLSRVRQLEADIFQLIENEVHKESEKIKKSPKNEKKRENSSGFEVLFENINCPKPPKTLEFQRRKFEEQKVEVSSSSDLDDPIERHSKSEELRSARNIESDKDNLQKEITDVDKDFFEDLLQKSKEKAEAGGISGSSSLGQEDFSHFLKLLQGQSDKKDEKTIESNPVYNFLLKPTDGKLGSNVDGEFVNDKSPEFPEKEFSEILEKELPRAENRKTEHEITETDSSSSVESRESRNSGSLDRVVVLSEQRKSDSMKKDESPSRNPDVAIQGKKVVNSKQELYTVGLTPRLELFADAIPKLLAEKSIENTTPEEGKETIDYTFRNIRKTTLGSQGNLAAKNVGSASSIVKPPKREMKFAKSKSYDQISKVPSRGPSENVRAAKPLDSWKKPIIPQRRRSPPLLKSKLQFTSKPLTKVAPKKTKLSRSSYPVADPTKSGSVPSLFLTLKNSHRARSPPEAPTSSSNPMAGGDSKFNSTRQNWEILCREEKRKNALLKQQLEAETKLYKSRIDDMRISFEEELFALKKQNIILKAKVDEFSLKEKRLEIQPKSDTKIILVEKELEKQEKLIRAYETENEKLLQDTKRLREELKEAQREARKPIIPVNISNKTNELLLSDRLKDLEEGTLKLNLEVSSLRRKNDDWALKYEDLQQQNCLLSDELEMFKDQLRTKNDFITNRLQAMTSVELELKKQTEELGIKLGSRTEQLRLVKLDYEKLERNVLPLEKELLELRLEESSLREKLRVSKSHVEREKQLTIKLKDQVILDSKKITDLNRQIREMERILRRKNPDSVSALILTANSDQDRIRADKVNLLEERIKTLEAEIRAKDDLAQRRLDEFQQKFASMKEKYAAQLADLEAKLSESTPDEPKICREAFTQTTTSKTLETKAALETLKKEDNKAPIAPDKDPKLAKVSLKSQNPKEDAHLIATIRGLKLELSAKEKTVSKLTKEFQELQKTNRRLQKEREKLLNDRRTIKTMDHEKSNRCMLSSLDSKLPGYKSCEGNDQNSNVYQNGHASDPNTQRLSASMQKLYDPMHYTENGDNGIIVKRLTNENEILKEELDKMNKDFMALKNKRLHDLNLLQEEHEREMATLLKEYSIKFGESKMVKLQGHINTQVAVITHLKQQIEKMRDYKEQVVVLKAEREHLENKVKTLNEKVKYLSTPGTEQLQLLQDKITILQQRHESREMTLQTLVRDLIRNRTQCKDCKNEKGKNRQLCFFRQELDHILGMLQEIANVH